MRPRVVLPALALVLCLSACGSGTTQPTATGNTTPTARGSATLVSPRGSASGRPSTRPTLRVTPKPVNNSVVVVGTSDSGVTVELHVDDYLRVELDAAYRQPTLSRRGVLKRTSATGGYPTGRKVVTVFRAVAAGRTDVESMTDYACLHATPRCGVAQQLWMVHVVVRR